MNKLTISLLLGIFVLIGTTAQETINQIGEISVINYGDGRLLFRQTNEAKTPLNGVTKEFYYQTGKPKSEYNYKNGKREGAYKRFNDDGSLKEEGRCENDNEVLSKEYYPDGKLKSVAERRDGIWKTIEEYKYN